MALRYFFKTANLVPPKAEAAAELQVDYSHTQWRYAQMLQQERNYRAACDAVDGAAGGTAGGAANGAAAA